MVKKGYKQTEIGVIPEDWEVKPAKDLMRIETGSRNTEHKVDHGQYPFFVRSQQVERIETYHYDCEAVLTAGDGVGTGKVFHYINGKFDAHQRVYVMSNFESILGKYFFYFFSKNFGAEVSKYTAKSSVDSVRRDMIAEMLIPVPSEDEQKGIYEAVSDVEQLIETLEKQLTKKKAIKQGTMQELLTGKRRLPGFSGEWSKCKLGSLGVLLKGTGISRNDSNSGNLPAVRYGELYTKHRNYVNSYFSHISKEVASNAQRVYRGDILFAASGETKEDIGKCSAIIYETAAYAGGDILIFRPTAQLDPVFMGTLLNMADARKQRAEQGQGDAVVHIHADALSSISIMIPNTEEQQAIAEILIGMDKEIELLERKLEKYRQVKQGMMQQLLTGKIRLV